MRAEIVRVRVNEWEAKTQIHTQKNYYNVGERSEMNDEQWSIPLNKVNKYIGAEWRSDSNSSWEKNSENEDIARAVANTKWIDEISNRMKHIEWETKSHTLNTPTTVAKVENEKKKVNAKISSLLLSNNKIQRRAHREIRQPVHCSS